jgi:SNARE associated Golgi protein
MNLVGPRLSRIRNSLARRGVLAVATVRMVPLAPFTLVNVVAGASQIRLTDYLAGTALGMAPGLIALSALGHQILSAVASAGRWPNFPSNRSLRQWCSATSTIGYGRARCKRCSRVPFPAARTTAPSRHGYRSSSSTASTAGRHAHS